MLPIYQTKILIRFLKTERIFKEEFLKTRPKLYILEQHMEQNILLEDFWFCSTRSLTSKR